MAGVPSLNLPPAAVETEATPEQLAAMLARIGTYWAGVGAVAPHWSVLVDERFRPERIGDVEAHFYKTGAHDAALFRSALARHGISPAQLPRCVEFGCGVGRVSVHLAGLFRRVTACDISPPHLALAQAACAARGLTRVLTHHTTLEAPMPQGRWEAWFSAITLQHNPPPVMRHLLGLGLAGLMKGGVAMFQLPSFIAGYRFAVAEYLDAAKPPYMEMHALPQAAVFATIAQAGCEVLEVREQPNAFGADGGEGLSNWFLARRRR
jgi:SAM-dependent methyltransferase